MNDEGMICPTCTETVRMTVRYLKPKLLIYSSPRNVTYIVLATVC